MSRLGNEKPLTAFQRGEGLWHGVDPMERMIPESEVVRKVENAVICTTQNFIRHIEEGHSLDSIKEWASTIQEKQRRRYRL